MKKIFTLAAAALLSVAMWAAYPTATTTYALEDLTFTEATLTYEKTGLSGDAQKLNKVLYIDVEVPCASANGNLYLRGTGSNTGRFATIWGSNGTERDEARKVAMKNGNSDAIAFTEADILEDGGKYYIRFSSADNNGSYYDYKISGFSYVLAEECVNKTIVSTVETLTGVTVNGTAMSAEQFNSLTSAPYYKGGFPGEEFAAAPTFVFTKHIVITYDDSTTKESDVEVEVEGVADAGEWVASLTINSIEYHVYAVKLESVTVTYMDGETVLGTEIVAKAGTSAEYAQYETKPLATFEGWYSDAALTQPINLAEHMFSADETVYAKFTKAYLANSVNIEGWIVANGKNTNDFKAVLDAANIEYDKIDALDSLNDSKGAARNEAYLGLKIKKQGGYIACNVQAGQTVRVKFGYVAADVKAYANDQEMTLAPTENALNVLEFTAAEETYVKIQTTSDKTVVIKQIMLDEPVANVMYPIAYNIGEGGTVTGWTIAFPGEEVVMNITSDEGNALYSLTYNEIPMVQTAPGAPIFFTMPAEPVTVAAEFGIATGINNAEETVKTVKVLRNGQLFIEKNGVLFNAQGARL